MRDDRQLGHNFSSSNISAVADALRGGTDSNCGTPNFYSKYLLPALQVRHIAASIRLFRSLNSAPRVETTLGTKVRMHSGRDGLVSLFRHTQGGLVNASRIDLAFARVAQLILRLGLLVSTVQSFIRPCLPCKRFCCCYDHRDHSRSSDVYHEKFGAWANI